MKIKRLCLFGILISVGIFVIVASYREKRKADLVNEFDGRQRREEFKNYSNQEFIKLIEEKHVILRYSRTAAFWEETISRGEPMLELLIDRYHKAKREDVKRKRLYETQRLSQYTKQQARPSENLLDLIARFETEKGKELLYKEAESNYPLIKYVVMRSVSRMKSKDIRTINAMYKISNDPVIEIASGSTYVIVKCVQEEIEPDKALEFLKKIAAKKRINPRDNSELISMADIENLRNELNAKRMKRKRGDRSD